MLQDQYGGMSTKIGIISDPHATPAPLQEALAIFQREGVSHILCAGDIGGYGERLDETVALLKEHEVIAVCGNHEQWALQQGEFPGSEASRGYFESLPLFVSLCIEGIKLYMVHAEPPDKTTRGLRLFDQHGQVMPEVLAEWHERLEGFPYQALILGHTHQAYEVKLAKTLVINPGSSCFNHSCAILQLPSLDVEWYSLSGRKIEKMWNWGSNQIKQ